MDETQEHTLEFLLAFNGQTHWYEGGYFIKFEMRRARATPERPHDLRFSFTLHDPQGKRLLGYDNAHRVRAKGARYKAMPAEADHWHRTENDPGTPYRFTDAAALLEDFFSEVERVLTARGVPVAVIETKERKQED